MFPLTLQTAVVADTAAPATTGLKCDRANQAAEEEPASWPTREFDGLQFGIKRRQAILGQQGFERITRLH